MPQRPATSCQTPHAELLHDQGCMRRAASSTSHLLLRGIEGKGREERLLCAVSGGGAVADGAEKCRRAKAIPEAQTTKFRPTGRAQHQRPLPSIATCMQYERHSGLHKRFPKRSHQPSVLGDCGSPNTTSTTGDRIRSDGM